MKEGGGGDHLSVGVKLPGSKRITPVSRKNVYLKPPGRQTFCYFNLVYPSFTFRGSVFVSLAILW